MAIKLDKPSEIRPGVVSYAVRACPTPSPSRPVAVDQNFVRLLRERLEKQARAIQSNETPR
jgi:hypothetical protein